MGKKVLLIVALLAVAHTGFSQDFKEALEELQIGIREAKHLRLKMDIKVFESQDTSEVYYQQITELCKSADSYLYTFGKSEILQTNGFLLMIDHEEKEIVMRKSEGAKGKTPEMFPIGIDSLLKYYETPQILEKQGALVRFRLEQKEGPLDWMEMVINTQTASIKQLDYLYLTGQLARIHFTLFDKAPVFEENLFNEKRYVIQQGASFKGTGVYHTYRVNLVPESN